MTKSKVKSTSYPHSNPTLHPHALTDVERASGLKWHSHASSPRSSQAFCLSAFGTLRSITARDAILKSLFRGALACFPRRTQPLCWTILPERENRELLSEFGTRQPTSIDALCVSADEVVCIKSKFVSDAGKGFGGCGQYSKSKPEKKCAGFRGPGSDLATRTGAWCRLENWEGERSPRSYWSLGKRWFRTEVFELQTSANICPLRGPNYQLMRNFLFAASMAERDGKSHFGVVTIGPHRFAPILSEQVAAFQKDVLQDQFSDRIAFVDYETYAGLLDNSGDPAAIELAHFIRERIRSIVDQAVEPLG